MRSWARSVRLSTNRLTRLSPTRISRKQSVARNSADALAPPSSHSAKNLTPFILFYRPSLVLACRTGAGTLIGQEAVPHLALLVTIPNSSRKTVAPVRTVEILLLDRIAHPERRPLAISLGNQRTNRGYVSRAPSWSRQAEPGSLVLVLVAPDILAPVGEGGQVIGNFNRSPAVWALCHVDLVFASMTAGEKLRRHDNLAEQELPELEPSVNGLPIMVLPVRFRLQGWKHHTARHETTVPASQTTPRYRDGATAAGSWSLAGSRRSIALTKAIKWHLTASDVHENTNPPRPASNCKNAARMRNSRPSPAASRSSDRIHNEMVGSGPTCADAERFAPATHGAFGPRGRTAH